MIFFGAANERHNTALSRKTALTLAFFCLASPKFLIRIEQSAELIYASALCRARLLFNDPHR